MAPTGERKKITKEILKGGGNEGTVDSKNANKYDVLLVVYKGSEIIGVVGFKITNNQNGLACSDLNLHRMLGLVGDPRSLSSLSTSARDRRKKIDLMKFTKKVPER